MVKKMVLEKCAAETAVLENGWQKYPARRERGLKCAC
jgi:hypothetical protein